MGKRLVLLRHGLTSWNAEGRFQGHADVELTETGHLQAKAAASALAGLSPVVLWSSDLLRAAHTAEYVAEACGLVPVLDARLREIHVGDFQGISHGEAAERFGPGPWDYVEYGGESQEAAGARVADALQDLAASLPPEQTAVVVSHGASLRLGAADFLGWPVEIASTLGGLDNCAWIELVETGGSPHAATPWRLAAYNRRTPIS